MAIDKGLNRRLGRSLLLQAIYISLAVLVGIFVAARLVENVLIEQALIGEAEYYWSQEAANPGQPLPDTKNLTTYRSDHGDGLPDFLHNLEPGFHKLDQPRELLALVSVHGAERALFVFEVEQVEQLVTLFGLIPLSLALTVIYLSLYSAYRVSRQAVSPIVALAHQVQELDPSAPDPKALTIDPSLDPDEEIVVLQEALQDLIRKVTEYTERERHFTRDASHELRTPLTVIKMAAERLLKTLPADGRERDLVERIRNNASDMNRLTEAFLLLAREWEEGLDRDWVCVNEIAALELERMRIIYPDAPIEPRLEERCRLFVLAPNKVVESVIGNLVRNAFAYTDAGSVTVRIDRSQVEIEDTGAGMDEHEVEQIFEAFFSKGRQRGGFGVGLTIVKRLTERFNWSVDFDSEPGSGTTVTVRFPGSRYELTG
ncbi:MAG: HAMP domain-containing sensor histidine kinase [Pseudomonadota bacterium]